MKHHCLATLPDWVIWPPSSLQPLGGIFSQRADNLHVSEYDVLVEDVLIHIDVVCALVAVALPRDVVGAAAPCVGQVVSGHQDAQLEVRYDKYDMIRVGNISSRNKLFACFLWS